MYKAIEIIDKHRNRICILPEELTSRCRTCVINVGEFPIFSTKHKDVVFNEMFTALSLPEINSSDGLPQQLCGDCAKQFIEFYSFKERIEQLHIILEIAISKSVPTSLNKQTQQKLPNNNDHELIFVDTSDIIKSELLDDVQQNLLNNNDDDDDGDDDDVIYVDTSNIQQSEMLEDDGVNENIDDTNVEVKPVVDNMENDEYSEQKISKIEMITKDEVEANNLKKIASNKVTNNTESLPLLTCSDCQITFRNRTEYFSHRRKVRDKKKREMKENIEKECRICFKKIINYKMNDHMKLHFADNDMNNISLDNLKLEVNSINDKDNIIERNHVTDVICIDDTNIEEKADENNKEEIISDVNVDDIKKEVLDDEKYTKTNTTNDATLDHSYIKKQVDIKYKCAHCNLVFDVWADYYRHTREEIQNRKGILCKLCNKKISRKNIEKHADLHEKLKCRNADMYLDPQTAEFVCGICNNKFDDESSFTLHKINRKPTILPKSRGKYPCDVCGKKYKLEILNDHMNIHTKQKPYMCDICGKTFAFQTNLRAHSHAKFLCDKCGNEFSTKRKLTLHIWATHLQYKPHACHICQKKFLKKVQLNLHMRRHTGERPCLCIFCGKRFVQDSHLKTHIKNIHSNERPLRCEICNRGFTEQFALNYHMKQHEQNKRYEKCILCNQFTNNLSYHMDLHSQGYKVICGRCHEVFDTTSDLQHHKTQCTQKSVANLKCDICGKVYKAAAQLKLHRRTHTGERPYKCDVCRKRFVQKSHLSCHMKLHTGEKRFQCSFCGKRFTLNGNLQQHIRCHTQDKPFVCEICLKTFSTNSSLRKHEIVHNKKMFFG